MFKAAIFLDHSNLASPILKKAEFRDYVINYRKLRKILFQDFTPVGAFAFLGVTNPVKSEKKRFINYLEMSGFNTFSRELIKRRNSRFINRDEDEKVLLFLSEN